MGEYGLRSTVVVSGGGNGLGPVACGRVGGIINLLGNLSLKKPVKKNKNQKLHSS